MTAHSQSSQVYALSDVQKFYDFKEQHKRTSGKVYVGAQLADNVVFDLKQIQAKVLELMKEHSQLHIQVTPNHEVYQLNLDALNLDDFVYVHLDNEYENIDDIKLVHYFLHEPPMNGCDNIPLWRLVYLPKLRFLIFNFGHTFYDGISGAAFLRELFEKLSDPHKKSKIVDYKQKFKGNVVDEKLLNIGVVDIYPRPTLSYNLIKSVCWDYLKQNVLEPVVMAAITFQPQLLKYRVFQLYNRYTCKNIKPRSNEYIDKHKCVRIDADQTRSLISYCKKHGVTLNTLQVSLLSLTSPLSYNKEPFVSKINIPINMRPRLFDSSDSFKQNVIALAISATQVTSLPISKKTKNDRFHFNDFLLKMDSHIKKSIEGALDMASYTIASFYRNSPQSLLPAEPSVDGELSNLGLLKHQLIKDVIFNQGVEPCNYMNVSAIGGAQGTRFSFMWYSGSNGEIEKRIEDFEKLLHWVIKEA
ncbi:hypothetical protein QEN19_004217 [Hanseniaspora menglaensis]